MKRLILLLLIPLFACSHEHDDGHEHVVPQLVVDTDAAIIIDIDPPLKLVTDEWDADPSVIKQAVILEPADKEDHVITVTFSKPPLYVSISYHGAASASGKLVRHWGRGPRLRTMVPRGLIRGATWNLN